MTRLLPLTGVRVADFSWVGAGPIATRTLAEFGADVIRIESKHKLDITRQASPFKDGIRGINRSGYYNNRNPGKKSICLNMSYPYATQVAAALIKKSDIVINNFTAGTMEKWGLGYDAVKQIRSDIIYVSMLLHGSTGPHKDYMGFGSTMNALVGLNYLTAHPGKEPYGMGTNYPDHVPNPLNTIFAILVALRHRTKTGEGQYIELSQTETAANITAVAIMDYANNGVVEAPQGNRRPGAAPHGVYRTKGKQNWIAIAVYSDEEWNKLKEVLDNPHWAVDGRFDTAERRQKHQDELDRLLEGWTSTQDRDDLYHRLVRVGIHAGMVLNGREAVRDPQLNARRHWVYLDHPETGYTVYDASPIQMSQTPPCFETAAPLLGEHTRTVMCDLVGMSEEEYERLAGEGLFE